MSNELSYGPVVVTAGLHEGRIGYYDDDDEEFAENVHPEEKGDTDEPEGTSVAIVYFGAWLFSTGYFCIPKDWLRFPTTEDLMRRKSELEDVCNVFASQKNPTMDLGDEQKLDLMYELHYVESELVRRLIEARYVRTDVGQKVFISHSSKDKTFARWLWSDLKAAGHRPWIDEDEIKIGQSIPKRIAQGLSETCFVVVILSEHAVESRWVESEWHSKYWDEIQSGSTYVLPVLYQPCKVPEFLKTKKYADFSVNYNSGLGDLLLAIKELSEGEAGDA